jgi:transposase InsO family protein
MLEAIAPKSQSYYLYRKITNYDAITRGSRGDNEAFRRVGCRGLWVRRLPAGRLPEEVSVRYLWRDRDTISGDYFQQRVRGLGLKKVLSAPRSPGQNGSMEGLIGSIRRECLDHVIVMNEQHLRRILHSYFEYYHRTRTQLSVDKDAPDTRPVQLRAMGYGDSGC